MNTRTIFFFFFLGLWTCNFELETCSAQTPTTVGERSRTIDSLKHAISTAKNDTTNISALNALSIALYSTNPDSTILLAQQAAALAQTVIVRERSDLSNLLIIQTAQKGEANAYGNAGVGYWVKGDYSKALEYFFKALKIDKALKNKSGIAKRLGNIGLVYWNQADYPQSLDYYFKALKMKEELGDKNEIAKTLGNIGNVYYIQTNYPTALDYYLKALKTAEELGNKSHIAACLGNIGNVYKDQDDYPKALDYHLKALKMAEESGDKQLQANTLGNIGNVYSGQADYPQALHYYFKVLKINEELGNKYGIAINLANISLLYTKTGKFKEAEDGLKKAIAIDSSIGAQNELRQCEELLSKLYDTTGQAAGGSGSWQLAAEKYKLSMVHYKKAMVLKDTIFSEENKKQLIRKEMQYEFEKAQIIKEQEEKEQQRLKQEAVERRNILQYSGILIVLVVLFSVIAVVIPSLRGISPTTPQWLIEGPVFLTFLLFFEFLLVLLDPQIEQWAGGEPVYKLLFNAGIAALIFPLHAFFEGMLKRRLLNVKRQKSKEKNK